MQTPCEWRRWVMRTPSHDPTPLLPCSMNPKQRIAGACSGTERLAVPTTHDLMARRSLWGATTHGRASGKGGVREVMRVCVSCGWAHALSRLHSVHAATASFPPCSAGDNHTCGVLLGEQADRIACFGASAAGQLGDGNRDQNMLGSTPRVSTSSRARQAGHHARRACVRACV